MQWKGCSLNKGGDKISVTIKEYLFENARRIWSGKYKITVI